MIEILYFDGCPNHEPTVDLAREVVSELGLDAEIREVPVETPEEAEALRFVGSPSVRVNGHDIEPAAREQTAFALSCRMYGDAGVPPKELLVEALREES
jgi:hypothetical protein